MNDMVHYTISQDWKLGNAVKEALRQGEDPVEAIMKLQKALLLCKGKVSSYRLQDSVFRGFLECPHPGLKT